jgi:alkanesulfonate monooxygenase SsuD/methylene tetrahydromethanopterin reductase-like flavin-dependent oxidoreductase (luciferase family)
VTFEGRFYRFDKALCTPRPVQRRLPILVGGAGPRKTIPLIARSADMWNMYGAPAEVAASNGLLVEACAAVGRDPSEIERTVNLNIVIRGSHSEAQAAWDDWFRDHSPRGGEGQLDAGGSVADVAATLREYRDAGFDHPVCVFRVPWDLETIDRLPQLRAALEA